MKNESPPTARCKNCNQPYIVSVDERGRVQDVCASCLQLCPTRPQTACSICNAVFTPKDARVKKCDKCRGPVAPAKLPITGGPVSDQGLADYMKVTHILDMKYSTKVGAWFHWDDTYWRKEEGEKLALHKINKTVEALIKTGGKDLDKRDKAKFTDAAVKLGSYNKMESARKLLEADPDMQKDFQRERDMTELYSINVKNGLVDLKTGEIRPHDREHYISHCLESPYDPDYRHPVWDKIVRDVCCDDPDLMLFLQVACGYSLMGANPDAKFFFMYGPSAANGKSTFLGGIRSATRGVSQTLDWSTVRHSNKKGGATPELYRMQGIRFAIANEAEKGKKMSEQLIKTWTGTENVVARDLYKSNVEFRPQVKVWLGTNFLPTLDSTDEGVWRRVEVIPFDAKFKGKQDDRMLKERVLYDADIHRAIITWLIKGSLMFWHEYNQNPDGLWLWSDRVNDLKELYREQLSPVMRFLREHTLPGGTYPKKSLYEHYIEYCKVVNEPTIGKKEFNREIEAHLGHPAKRTAKAELWEGIQVNKLAPVDEP